VVVVMAGESMNKLVCLASEAQERRLPRLFRSVVCTSRGA